MHVKCYSLRSILIVADLIQICTKSATINKDRRKYNVIVSMTGDLFCTSHRIYHHQVRDCCATVTSVDLYVRVFVVSKGAYLFYYCADRWRGVWS